jgi:putative endonuclease
VGNGDQGREAVMVRVKDAVGRFGEDAAARHLTEAGLSILERNWRASPRIDAGLRGELDIVARDGDALVVVEVKTRSGTAFGAPAEAVTRDKARRIRRLAAAWLAAHPNGAYASVRFDVVSVLRGRHGMAVEHLRGAF